MGVPGEVLPAQAFQQLDESATLATQPFGSHVHFCVETPVQGCAVTFVPEIPMHWLPGAEIEPSGLTANTSVGTLQ